MSQTTMCDFCHRVEREAGVCAQANISVEGQTLSVHICRSCATQLPGWTTPAAETGAT